MSKYVIVRVNEKLIPEFQINYSISDNAAVKSKIMSWEQIKLQDNQQLIIILTANLVLTTQVKIPSKNEEVIKQSIPFALEEELATDVNENHFSYSQLNDQLFLVSIINKKLIEKLQWHLKTAGLICKEVYSEIFTVPHKARQLVLCKISNGYIIRDDILGVNLDDSMLDTFLQLSENKNITYYSDGENQLKVHNKVEFNNLDTCLLQAKTIIDGQGVNIFQGEFTQNIDNKKSGTPWKKLIILTVLLIISWLTINLYELFHLSASIDNIKDQQKSLLIQSVPNASETEIKDPFSAYQSRIKQAQNLTISSNNQGFIIALSYLGKALVENSTIQIQSLRLREKKLEVKLLATNVNSLNQFQEDLKNVALTMRIKTGTRNSNQEGVSSTITMEQL
jgi:general secretion pathway protein L